MVPDLAVERDRMSSSLWLGALTLLNLDMSRSAGFQASLGFEMHHGGEHADFTRFEVGETKLNNPSDYFKTMRSSFGHLMRLLHIIKNSPNASRTETMAR